jgi:hypothetical protein
VHIALRHRLRLAALAFTLPCLQGAPAMVDVRGYVDEQGRAHVAPEKLDDRY